MKPTLVRKNIYVKKSSVQGYGVFAGEDINQGDVIEECCLLISKSFNEDYANIYFKTESRKDDYLIPLGFGSIYNHSKYSNADYQFDPLNLLLTFCAKRQIKKDEEIFVFYSKAWFHQRQMKEIERFRYKIRSLRPLFFLLLRFAIVLSLLIGLILFLK